MSTQAPRELGISTFTRPLCTAVKIFNNSLNPVLDTAMKVSRLLVSLCLSNGGLALSRRQRSHPANGTTLQPKQYILEFQPASPQPKYLHV